MVKEPITGRIVVQFSCGAASAVAAKLVLGEYGLSHEVHLINAFLKEEHPDNRRFLADCERWLNHPIIVLRDEKYGASVREVFRRKRYLKGQRGAPCRKALKGDVLDAYMRPGDVWVLGYTADVPCASGAARFVGDTERDRLRVGRRTAADLADQSGDGPLRGFWSGADWIACRDGKWRPVEPGAFPLAHGATGRVGRLRAYGNAIVAPQAAEFIRAYCGT